MELFLTVAAILVGVPTVAYGFCCLNWKITGVPIGQATKDIFRAQTSTPAQPCQHDNCNNLTGELSTIDYFDGCVRGGPCCLSCSHAHTGELDILSCTRQPVPVRIELVLNGDTIIPNPVMGRKHVELSCTICHACVMIRPNPADLTISEFAFGHEGADGNGMEHSLVTQGNTLSLICRPTTNVSVPTTTVPAAA